MHARPDQELRCPTCGARQGWSRTCRRCKSDLGLLVAALETYERHRRAGLLALADGRLDAALQHAGRCHELRPGHDADRLLAVCQLLRGDWPEAIRVVHRHVAADQGRIPGPGPAG